MSNKIFTEIVAQDSFSPVFKKLGESIRGNALAANLMASGITSAIGAATSAVSSLTKSIGEAAELQLNNASAAGTFAALTGKSFSDGEQFIDRLNSKLGEVAAALPGATQDYKTLALGIQDNLIPAFKDASGAFDSKAFEEELVTITKGMEVLGASSQTAAKDVSKFTGKFLGGSSISELKNLIFAENNTGFLALVEKRLEGTGKKLEQLTLTERKEILKAVSQQLVTPEVIKAASGSVSGLIESLKSNLFDPTNGVFGLMRDLDTKTKGNQTVLTAINEGLDLLIGEKGLFNTIGTTLQALGIEFGDPMVSLRNSILWFNSKVRAVRDSLTNFSDIMGSSPLPKDVGKSLKAFIYFVGNDLGNISQSLVRSIVQSIAGIGVKTGQLFNSGVNLLKGIDFAPIFRGIGTILASAINELAKFLSTIDWRSVASLLYGVVRASVSGLEAFLSTLDWGTVGQVLLKGVGLALMAVPVSIAALTDIVVIQPLAAAIGVAVSFISSKIQELGNWASSSIQALIQAFTGFWNGLTSSIQSKLSEVASTATNVFDTISNWFNGLLSKIPFLGKSTNSAGGFVPNAANGMNLSLLEAIARENRAKPSGSNLLIANDSELILNRSQQAALASNTNGSSPSFTISNLTIQTQATDAKGIAKDVMRELAAAYSDFTNSRLVAA